jgi:hypothetical protein
VRSPFILELTGREHVIPESVASKTFQAEKGLVLNVEVQVRIPEMDNFDSNFLDHSWRGP